jgi:trehalose 6-phosphate phosphatase
MTASLREETDRLLSAHRGGRPLALLFDYDGTLVPIVERPERAQLAPETRRLLERLARQPRLSLGIFSGRMIEDLKAMVGLPGLYYGGTSGLELEPGGVLVTPAQAAQGRALIEGLAARLGQVAAQYPGAWVENKRLGLTLHYRAVGRHQIENLRARGRQVLQPFAGQVRILGVAMALEVTLDLGATKGSAVRRVVAQAGPGALPLYAGDDANDGDALEAAAALGGIALGIGPRAPSSAQHRLPDPATLAGFLSRFLEALAPDRAEARRRRIEVKT